MNIRAIARVAVLVLSLATVSIGIWLTSAQTLSIATMTSDNPETYESSNIAVGGVGIALLAVGLLMLAATLIAEGHRPRDLS